MRAWLNGVPRERVPWAGCGGRSRAPPVGLAGGRLGTRPAGRRVLQRAASPVHKEELRPAGDGAKRRLWREKRGGSPVSKGATQPKGAFATIANCGRKATIVNCGKEQGSHPRDNATRLLRTVDRKPCVPMRHNRKVKRPKICVATGCCYFEISVL